MGTTTKQGYFGTPPIVTNGLIFHLDAGSRLSYAGSGATWNNLSGNTTISGSLQNSPTFDVANQGSIQTNGTNSWILLGTATQLGWSSVLTISQWYRYVSFTGATALSMWDLVGGVNQRTFVHTISATNQMQQNWSPDGIADGTNISGSAVLSLNTWYNYTSVFRSGVKELWQNGQLVASLAQATINTSATTNRLGISVTPGRAGDTSAGYTSGRAGILSLYNRALSPQEIAQNYNALKGRFGAP